MNMTRRIALTLATAFALSAPAFAQDPLRVASYPANPPWENKTESGTFEGYEVDIVTETAKRMGTTAEIEGMDFKALFVASASGRADMVISSLTITDERLESQSFTQPYFEGALGIGVKEGSDIASVEGLKGKVVGSVAGVRECAVFGRRHPMLDEVPVAFVIPVDPADTGLAERVLEACAATLASFKRPHEVRLVPELAVGACAPLILGQIAKAELRAVLVAEG